MVITRREGPKESPTKSYIEESWISIVKFFFFNGLFSKTLKITIQVQQCRLSLDYLQ